MATLLGVALAGLALSADAQEIIQKGATTGRMATPEEQYNKIDDENAPALPLPAAPDCVAEQAKKDFIDNLIKGERSSHSGHVGQEAGSEGDRMTNHEEPGTLPPVSPRRNHMKRP
ncbi:MAG TPA: hypothetical protein PKD12_08700 [Nitrospira sp.]|nr:hypothetical protein [Nitrospira sp.]